MRKRLRHRLVMLLIASGAFKALGYLIFPAFTFTHGHVSSNSGFCQTNGFFILFANDGSGLDFAVFVIALHSVLYLFKPSVTRTDGRLYRYRYFVYLLWIIYPALMGTLAFVSDSKPYVNVGTFCDLPVNPTWYRLALSWVPRYIVFTFNFMSALFLFLYVKIKICRFDSGGCRPNSQSTIPVHQVSKMTPRLRSYGFLTPNFEYHGPASNSISTQIEYFASRKESQVSKASKKSKQFEDIDNPPLGGIKATRSQSTSVLPEPSFIPRRPKLAKFRRLVQSDSFLFNVHKDPYQPRHIDGPKSKWTNNQMIDLDSHGDIRRDVRCVSIVLPVGSKNPESISNEDGQRLANGPIRALTSSSTSEISVSIMQRNPSSQHPRRSVVTPPPSEQGVAVSMVIAPRSHLPIHRQPRHQSATENKSWGSNLTNNVDSLRRSRDTINSRLGFLFIYPLVYTLMWIVPFIQQCFYYNSHYIKYPVLHNSILIIRALHTMVDCLVFSIREKPWQRINNCNETFWGSLYIWRKEDNSSRGSFYSALPVNHFKELRKTLCAILHFPVGWMRQNKTAGRSSAEMDDDRAVALKRLELETLKRGQGQISRTHHARYWWDISDEEEEPWERRHGQSQEHRDKKKESDPFGEGYCKDGRMISMGKKDELVQWAPVSWN
ncbi:MAG: hypothetical protein M1834_006972 [Cirrosporium novae-zelandiae]|nr:MAG: hypothetical protein M1834_006972 [Cirrosporium novae-zelandiae]